MVTHCNAIQNFKCYRNKRENFRTKTQISRTAQKTKGQLIPGLRFSSGLTMKFQDTHMNPDESQSN